MSLAELKEPGVRAIEGAKSFEWRYDRSDPYCNICRRSILEEEFIYHCNVCGSFDLCADCQEENISRASPLHQHKLTKCICTSSYPPLPASPCPVTTDRLRVSNLSFSTVAETVGKLFERYGHLQEALICTRNNRSLGYGYVRMYTVEEAKTAQLALNHTVIDGRKIFVEGAPSSE